MRSRKHFPMHCLIIVILKNIDTLCFIASDLGKGTWFSHKGGQTGAAGETRWSLLFGEQKIYTCSLFHWAAATAMFNSTNENNYLRPLRYKKKPFSTRRRLISFSPLRRVKIRTGSASVTVCMRAKIRRMVCIVVELKLISQPCSCACTWSHHKHDAKALRAWSSSATLTCLILWAKCPELWGWGHRC